MDFPDLPYLKQLQSDVWQSRAAVMVGAGFSRNAEPLPGVRERFPTWRELVRTMFDELHPLRGDEKPVQIRTREELFNRSSPPRIASEYEAAFERWRLDALIRAQNPDTKYRPGKLHRLLLELPWVDVFSTNYDTLLERTEVDKRAYYPVTKVAELTTAFSPRILKVHGSFPSQTPFIITEEDYRTYPRKFAAFVNTVQQSLLENSLVLVGFSGDDPNFLEWTGWIRDELGSDHAPIYLAGWLELGHAERQLLLKRGVTAIDLEPAFRGRAPTGDVRAAAIEAFLDSLHQGRKHRPEDWPSLRQFPSLVSVRLTPVETAPEPIDAFPRGPIDADTLAKVVRRWRYERERYPGWLVAPEEIRSEIWMRTERWITPLASAAERLPVADRVIVFREINWRFELAMAPLLTELTGPFRQSIDEAFSELAGGRVPIASSDFRSGEAENLEVADGWFEIAFGLLRDAREMYDSAGWSELKGKVDAVAAAHPEYSDRAQYEASLQAMWNVERAKAREILSNWRPSSQSPRAAIWKAGLLAELEELGEARTILRSALQEIRRALRAQKPNIELLSLEGWCSFLLPCVESSPMAWDLMERREEFRDRWAELKAWDCDPWSLWRYFDDALSTAPPRPRNAREETHGFDPGEVHVSYHLGGNGAGPYLPAFAYIHLYEKAGIPMHLSGVNIAGDNLKRSCLWIMPVWGFWIPALLVRACNHDALREAEFLGRARVATMNGELAQRLHTWCLQILERELTVLRGPIPVGSAQADLSKLLPDVVSRLAFRMGATELKEAFPVALRLHLSVRGDVRLHDCCSKWFSRLFEAAKPELLIEWLPELIRAPLFDDSLPDVPTQDFWPDPMRHFPGWRITGAAKEPALSAAISEAVDRLIAKVNAESGTPRARGVERLMHVFEAQLMNDLQKSRFGDLLWNARGTNGLPERWRFVASSLAGLPHPADIDVSAIIRTYVLGLSPAGAVHTDTSGRTSVAFGGPPEQLMIMEATFASKPLARACNESAGFIDWSDDEARTLYRRAREWWNGDQRAFEVPRDAPLDTGFPQRTAKRLGEFLARIVLPRMRSSSDQEWGDLLSWLEEIRSKGAHPTVALPYVLLHRPGEAPSIAATIRNDIDSDSEGAVSSAARAIRHWTKLRVDGHAIPEPEPALLSALIHRVVFRQKPAIDACLAHLACLIVETPEVVTPDQASTMVASLASWKDATDLSLDSDCYEFRETERPDLRARVSCLAGALSAWYKKRSPERPLPEGVVLWETMSKSDPLPEVRREFHRWDSN